MEKERDEDRKCCGWTTARNVQLGYVECTRKTENSDDCRSVIVKLLGVDDL